MKNTKSKGSRFENDIKRYLNRIGYDAIRGAASLGNWDVVGLPLRSSGFRFPLYVQAKSNRWPSGKVLKEYTDAADNAVGRAEVWMRRDGNRWQPPEIWVRDLNDWSCQPSKLRGFYDEKDQRDGDGEVDEG